MLNWIKNKLIDYSRSPKWSNVRKEHLINESKCRACGRKKDLEVHHIIPYHIKPEYELNPNNLITLCSNCHLLFGHLMDYKSWNVNVVTDCEQISLKIKNRPYNEQTYQQPPSWISYWFNI